MDAKEEVDEEEDAKDGEEGDVGGEVGQVVELEGMSATFEWLCVLLGYLHSHVT